MATVCNADWSFLGEELRFSGLHWVSQVTKTRYNLGPDFPMLKRLLGATCLELRWGTEGEEDRTFTEIHWPVVQPLLEAPGDLEAQYLPVTVTKGQIKLRKKSFQKGAQVEITPRHQPYSAARVFLTCNRCSKQWYQMWPWNRKPNHHY